MKTPGARAQMVAESPMRAPKRSSAPPLLVFPGGEQLRTLQNASGLLSRVWNWFRERQSARSNCKRLRVASSVSLGEKRFVAVVEVDGLEYLIGGGPSSVALLAQLKGNHSFGNLLDETMTAPRKQPAKRVRQPIAKPAAERRGKQA